MPAAIDPVLTSVARQEIPDCYVRVHLHDDGSRSLSLHAGSVNLERDVRESLARSVDPLRRCLEKLVDEYFTRRQPGWIDPDAPEAA